MSGAIDRHIEHVRELTQRYGPLDLDAPTASVNNPDWFDEDGDAIAGRRALHEQLISTLLVSGDREVGRHAVVLAGAPGAGKSHLREGELAEELSGHVRLDVDDIKHDLLVVADEDGSYSSFLKPPGVKQFEAEGERLGLMRDQVSA